jgi:hypothetical protein
MNVTQTPARRGRRIERFTGNKRKSPSNPRDLDEIVDALNALLGMRISFGHTPQLMVGDQQCLLVLPQSGSPPVSGVDCKTFAITNIPDNVGTDEEFGPTDWFWGKPFDGSAVTGEAVKILKQPQFRPSRFKRSIGGRTDTWVVYDWSGVEDYGLLVDGNSVLVTFHQNSGGGEDTKKKLYMIDPPYETGVVGGLVGGEFPWDMQPGAVITAIKPSNVWQDFGIGRFSDSTKGIEWLEIGPCRQFRDISRLINGARSAILIGSEMENWTDPEYVL